MLKQNFLFLKSSLQFSANRTHFVWQEAVTFFRRAVVPYRDLDLYFRYYDTFKRFTVAKDANVRFLFTVYYLALFYLAAINMVLYFFSPLNPLVHIVLFDVVFILQLAPAFYLAIVGLIAYTASLYWMMYCREVGIPLTTIAEVIVLGNDRKMSCFHPPSTDVVAVEQYVLFDGTFSRQRYGRVLLRITNALHLFMLLMDVGLSAIVGRCCRVLSDYFAEEGFGLGSVLTSAALFPVFLFHLVLFTCLIVSFCHMICFIAANGIQSLFYIISVFKRNVVNLRAATADYCSGLRLQICGDCGGHRRGGHLYRRRLQKSCSLQVKRLLRCNIHLFELIFIADAFYGQPFLLFLAVNLPVSAYCSTQIATGRLGGLVLFIQLMVVIESLVGNLVIHAGIGILCDVAHQGGKVLLSLAAAQCSGVHGLCLSVRSQLHLYTHVQRLYVRKKYGINYGGNWE